MFVPARPSVQTLEADQKYIELYKPLNLIARASNLLAMASNLANSNVQAYSRHHQLHLSSWLWAAAVAEEARRAMPWAKWSVNVSTLKICCRDPNRGQSRRQKICHLTCFHDASLEGSHCRAFISAKVWEERTIAKEMPLNYN